MISTSAHAKQLLIQFGIMIIGASRSFQFQWNILFSRVLVFTICNLNCISRQNKYKVNWLFRRFFKWELSKCSLCCNKDTSAILNSLQVCWSAAQQQFNQIMNQIIILILICVSSSFSILSVIKIGFARKSFVNVIYEQWSGWSPCNHVGVNLASDIVFLRGSLWIKQGVLLKLLQIRWK